MNGLMMHAGGVKVSLEELQNVKTPPSTSTWWPIPHVDLANTVLKACNDAGMTVESSEFGVWGGGERFFGVVKLSPKESDYTHCVGMRNSHTKEWAATLLGGHNVFVCDNLAFIGERLLSRKNTSGALVDLETRVREAMGAVRDMLQHHDDEIDFFKRHAITNTRAHDLVIRSVDNEIISNTKIPAVLKQWREPDFAEFKNRTLWSLFNAFTTVMGRSPTLDDATRTQALRKLLLD